MLPRPSNLGDENPYFCNVWGQDVDLISSFHLEILSLIPQGVLTGGPGPVPLPLATQEGDVYGV